MKQESAIYEGAVEHRRLTDCKHGFRYRLFMLYLDLEELPELFRRHRLWSVGRRNLAWFRRKDYLGSPDVPLADAVRARVEEELGRRPEGAVRLLTHVRTFGYLFNPVTFYYCHARDGALEAVVAEITNTPWRERRSYVLDAREAELRGEGARLRWRFDKDFHVSPFQDMDHVYEWTFDRPGEQLEVGMTNLRKGRPVFQVRLSTKRVPLDGRSLARMLLKHPLLTLRVHLAIYWQAARLFLKRVPCFTHPRKRKPVEATTSS